MLVPANGSVSTFSPSGDCGACGSGLLKVKLPSSSISTSNPKFLVEAAILTWISLCLSLAISSSSSDGGSFKFQSVIPNCVVRNGKTYSL